MGKDLEKSRKSKNAAIWNEILSSIFDFMEMQKIRPLLSSVLRTGQLLKKELGVRIVF